MVALQTIDRTAIRRLCVSDHPGASRHPSCTRRGASCPLTRLGKSMSSAFVDGRPGTGDTDGAEKHVGHAH